MKFDMIEHHGCRSEPHGAVRIYKCVKGLFLTWEDEANIGAICQRTKSTSMQVDCLN